MVVTLDIILMQYGKRQDKKKIGHLLMNVRNVIPTVDN